ncbi:MBL fold metallo-hydrolase [Candidatus Gracilibacteria bacterium]|nr:MBL fold metallo-hydrolase [Candidatus Gracilibacteria bacterium]
MINFLFEGVHTNHYHDGYYDIDPLCSSVTLIQHAGMNMLVDTGARYFYPQLMAWLAEQHVKPEDIHHIFNTHFHMDHCANDAFFPNATVWVGRSLLDYKTGRARIFGKLEKMEYPSGITMFLTPGHTNDHASYIYEEQGVKYVFGGDAVREDIIRSQKMPYPHVPSEFVPSMKKIFNSGDIVVPGHGRRFEGALKDELYELVCGTWK